MPVSSAVASSEDSTGVEPLLAEWRGARRVRRIERHHLPRYQPSEEHPDTRQMLLDRWRHLAAEQLYIGCYMHRLDVAESVNPLSFAPKQECTSRPRVCRAGVLVADIDGEEFQEPPGGYFACPRDERRKLRPGRLLDDGQFIKRIMVFLWLSTSSLFPVGLEADNYEQSHRIDRPHSVARLKRG